MNHSDGEKLETIFNDLGYIKTDSETSADLVAVVACSIRKSAVDRVYGKAHNWQLRRKQGTLKTILTGCVMESDKKKFGNLFDLLVGIKEINKLPAMLLLDKKQTTGINDYLNLPSKHKSSFQAYIPIMTGCNNFCSYCVVPYVRGREISRLSKDIISECKSLVKNGYKEITLLGQNVNSYKSGRYDFISLLKQIDNIPGEWRLRFLTSHPKDLSKELIEIIKTGKHITPHLHLPLQSGDDDILKAMNRKYSAKKFLRIIALARKKVPEIMISTDIIVGFPGEIKKQFQNTLKVFKEVQFHMAYISEYSSRKNTKAAKLNDNVAPAEKTRRKETLNELLKKTALANNKKYIDREVRVLVENYKNGNCIGKTETYKIVTFKGDKNLVGKFFNVKINKVSSWGLFA